jgi:hypothetical protein
MRSVARIRFRSTNRSCGLASRSLARRSEALGSMLGAGRAGGVVNVGGGAQAAIDAQAPANRRSLVNRESSLTGRCIPLVVPGYPRRTG